MHDYFEIKTMYEKASISDKDDLQQRIDKNKLIEFFSDMGTAYSTISYLNYTQKADFAQAICEFMDKANTY